MRKKSRLIHLDEFFIDISFHVHFLKKTHYAISSHQSTVMKTQCTKQCTEIYWFEWIVCECVYCITSKYIPSNSSEYVAQPSYIVKGVLHVMNLCKNFSICQIMKIEDLISMLGMQKMFPAQNMRSVTLHKNICDATRSCVNINIPIHIWDLRTQEALWMHLFIWFEFRYVQSFT